MPSSTSRHAVPLAPPRRRAARRRRFAAAPALLFGVLGTLAMHGGVARAETRVEPSGSPLSQRVADAVRENVPLAPAAHVGIRDRGGVITLTGWAATVGARERIAAVTEGTCGVRFVEVRMDVRPPERLDDSALETRLEAILAQGEGYQQPADVRATVSGGVVTLIGHVRVAEDKYAAEELVAWTVGPRAIENEIRLDPERGRHAFEDRLEAGLSRSLEGTRVAVVERDGRLFIEGVPHDVAARELVRQVLEAIPGGFTVLEKETLLVKRARTVPPPPYVPHLCD